MFLGCRVERNQRVWRDAAEMHIPHCCLLAGWVVPKPNHVPFLLLMRIEVYC